MNELIDKINSITFREKASKRKASPNLENAFKSKKIQPYKMMQTPGINKPVANNSMKYVFPPQQTKTNSKQNKAQTQLKITTPMKQSVQYNKPMNAPTPMIKSYNQQFMIPASMNKPPLYPSTYNKPYVTPMPTTKTLVYSSTQNKLVHGPKLLPPSTMKPLIFKRREPNTPTQSTVKKTVKIPKTTPVKQTSHKKETKTLLFKPQKKTPLIFRPVVKQQ